MSLLICGSIATDHLMTFPGRFKDSLVVDQLDKISLSFLVDDLEIRRGGVAANMCFGLGRLGLSPVLVGAAGEDFSDYRSWLERHGVDCSYVRISDTLHTARFVCTTDCSMAQFASFYPGAMSESRLIELLPIVEAGSAGPDYVLIAADDPEGMLRHTRECRHRGYPFIADPSQQLAFSDGELIRDLIDGATYLFSNEYESAHDRVRRPAGRPTRCSPGSAPRSPRWGRRRADPGQRRRADRGQGGHRRHRGRADGVGDAFRAGFLAGLEWQLGHERAAQVGCVLAAYVVETVGTQEYPFTRPQFVDRIRTSYGDAAADEVAAAHVGLPAVDAGRTRRTT